MKTQKTVIENLYDTSYQTVYNQFQTSALSVIKSLNYQSLVCLGVMDGDLFLQQMQSDMKTLKMEFLTTYNRIYTDLVDIEQKYTLEKDTSVVLFASGSSYTSEYAKLS
ncbi:TPA: hypothetical protein DEP21_04070 [Patescibacteria group bacterium]|nr:hypothetical protein [Candidatus Gracilibacteria bacterium]